jgi:ATP-dependent Clp protease ATP-binding subunit ClpA
VGSDFNGSVRQRFWVSTSLFVLSVSVVGGVGSREVLADIATTHNEISYELKAFGPEEKRPGIHLVRLSDSKALKVAGTGFELSEATLSEHKDGLLSIQPWNMKVDLNQFDAERRRAHFRGAPDIVRNDQGVRIDSVEKVEEDYQDLVARSRTHPKEFLENSDSAVIRKMAESLLLRKSVVLLGESGTGKSSAVRAFAREVGLGRVPGIPRSTKIYEVNVANLASGTRYTGAIEEKISVLVAASKATGAILFFDEIHSMNGVGTSQFSPNDIRQLIKKPLERGEMQIIGTDTTEEFNNSFGSDPAFAQRFGKIEVMSPATSELGGVIRSKLKREKLKQPDEAIIHQAIELSGEYDLTTRQPRAAINLIVDAYGKMMSAGQIGVPLTSEVLHEAAIQKYGFDPAQFSTELSLQRLDKLKAGLDLALIGQNSAKEAMIQLWKRKLIGVGDPNRVNSILFVGPPGVGKTSVAEASADLMAYRKTIIEMNKFKGPFSEEAFRREVYKALLDNPFRVIILDEIEKADISVQEAALSMLQSGEFVVQEKTLMGGFVSRKMSARHCLFLMTSNAAADLIKLELSESTHQVIPQKQLKSILEQGGISRMVLSRIREVVPMINPSKDEFRLGIETYVKRMLAREGARRKVKLVLTNEAAFVKEMSGSYTPESDFRDIQDLMATIENSIADALLQMHSPSSVSTQPSESGEGEKVIEVQWDTSKKVLKPKKKYLPNYS